MHWGERVNEGAEDFQLIIMGCGGGCRHLGWPRKAGIWGSFRCQLRGPEAHLRVSVNSDEVEVTVGRAAAGVEISYQPVVNHIPIAKLDREFITG